ncbi:MAG: hypothetical protein HYY92_01815 [Parcubacteria group bacterium]|nr:hypothetical protein [Parcubacteria group bacterium]
MSKGMLGMLPLSEIRGPRDTLEEHLAGPDGPEILRQLKLFNRKEPCWMPLASPTRILKPDGYYTAVTLTERHDPATFPWPSVNERYSYDSFRHNITEAAKPTEAGARWKRISRFRFTDVVTGRELLSEQPWSTWMATDFCPWIAAKLTKQAHGEKGELPVNGSCASFLVIGAGDIIFTVGVIYFRKSWAIFAGLLDDLHSRDGQFGSRRI